MSDTGYRLRRTLRALDELEARREKWRQEEQHMAAALQAIQADCPHIWEYIPDASGNNDSYERCEICGDTK